MRHLRIVVKYTVGNTDLQLSRMTCLRDINLEVIGIQVIIKVKYMDEIVQEAQIDWKKYQRC